MITKKSTANNSFNLEFEKFILGAMLLKDGEIIPNVVDILNAEDFYRPEHRIIFKNISEVFQQNNRADMLILSEHMRTNGDIDKVTFEYLFSLVEVAYTTANVEHYAQSVKEKANLRKLSNIADVIIQDTRAGLKSPADIIAEVTNAFYDLKTPAKNDFIPVYEHIFSSFFDYIEQRKEYIDRKIGFSNIDEVQSFDPGLYILGATPACGKTTFAWQLLEQLARDGENCIFCSYEMSKHELVAKSIARNLFQFNRFTTLTANQILHGGYSKGMGDVINEMAEYPNFIVKEFSYETVDKLLCNLRFFIKELQRPPIICIDYLQRIIPRDHKAADTRALIDDALYKLKDFSKETNATILAVSTFNRTNYNQFVSFESFKESGGIEYTADVVWAMQLAVTNKLSGEKDGDIRRKIEAAKKQQPRDIQLTCLKNRFGNNYDCYFHYYSAHDYFEPCTEFDFISNPKDDTTQNKGEVFDD